MWLVGLVIFGVAPGAAAGAFVTKAKEFNAPSAVARAGRSRHPDEFEG
jgi:hypothetical protein